MPKINQIQTSFVGGEFSPMMYGQVHADRYKNGAQILLNYIPTLQGPLIRRPGTIYVNNVKDSAAAPALIPFIYSQNQSLMLEFGQSYIRFYSNGAQVINASNVFQVAGTPLFGGFQLNPLSFAGTRPQAQANGGEYLLTSSVLAANAPFELVSPYTAVDAASVKWAQKNDVIYLTHPSYTPYKLQRLASNSWTISPVIFQDGPYLPYNSYLNTGDNTNVTLKPSATGGATVGLTTGSTSLIYGTSQTPSSGTIRIATASAHGFQSGQKVFIQQVPGTVEANNSMSSSLTSFWSIQVASPTVFDLIGSVYTNACTGSSGQAYPAMFQQLSGGASAMFPPVWADVATNCVRSFALIDPTLGTRAWGIIVAVSNPSSATAVCANSTFPSTSTCIGWQLGAFSSANGFPTATCFHQDRLILAGCPQYPQRLDGSVTATYETFAASGSNLQVADNNSISLHLLSDQANQLFWVKSSTQGLLAGSYSTEWQISPTTQAGALTPTNVNAAATNYFGSANYDAVQANNATVYIQRAQRKVRELNYFFQIGTFRSTDLSEIAEHITLPTVTKLAVQKETFPLIWALRSDGILASMTYSRDDLTMQAGWSRHILGGQSDAGGSVAKVLSFGVIPNAPNVATAQVPQPPSISGYDQLWMVVQRANINGSTFVSIEYLTRPFDDSFAQEDAFQGDCGATYYNPTAITGITSASSAIVTSPSHGLINGNQVKIVGVIGLNSSTTDVNGVLNSSNLVNEQTFFVGSATTNTFAILSGSSAYNSLSYSSWVSGGNVAKMITQVAGLSWLNGDTIGVYTDGANHPDCVVQSGIVKLNYPAAKVQFGYRYNSDGQSLRVEGGSAQGGALGELRRLNRVAAQLYRVGDFSMGPTFSDLVPFDFSQADVQRADQATPLYSGIRRDYSGGNTDYDAIVCWRQNSMSPGMIQSLTYFVEVEDV